MKKIVSIFLTLLIMINTLPVFADLDGYVYIRSVNVRDNEMTVTAVNVLNLSSSNTEETSDITVKVTRLADKCIIYERTRVMLENTAEDFVLELPQNEEGVIPYGIYEVEAVNNRGDKDVWNWEHKNIIISNVYASDGKGTVEITNLSQGVTEVTVTVMKMEDGFSDDDRTYGFYQRTLWGGTTSKFKFDIPEDKNGIKPYGTYRISVRTNEGQKLQRDWTYMQYTYTENIDQKFEYLTSIGVMDETNTGEYIVRHVLKFVLGEEPAEARFFRQLSQRTFLNYVCNILGNYGFTGKYSKEAIKIAEEEGLIEAGRTDHYKPLVYEDAVKILTKALGFKDLQTEEDYMFAAESLGLLDGVAATEGGRIKTFDAITLLYNTTVAKNDLEMNIIRPRFYDESGERITELKDVSSGSTITVRAAAGYCEDMTESVVLMVGMYKDDVLCNIKTSGEYSITEDKEKTVVSCEIKLPENQSPTDYVLRAYLWENTNGMKPLCSLTEIK